MPNQCMKFIDACYIFEWHVNFSNLLYFIILQDIERRDSIPEEIEAAKNLPAVSMEIHDIPEKNENCSCVPPCKHEDNELCNNKPAI